MDGKTFARFVEAVRSIGDELACEGAYPQPRRVVVRGSAERLQRWAGRFEREVMEEIDSAPDLVGGGVDFDEVRRLVG